VRNSFQIKILEESETELWSREDKDQSEAVRRFYLHYNKEQLKSNLLGVDDEVTVLIDTCSTATV
jgi:uncharacterized protein YnzC (UPF0291/DUF896 family)